ncbi:hypothetical protein [Streptomyces ipomoeae]|uniref:hypothetical protein n=1 Tax=Streptomyces ipomoeae TaxID=103232 RepID=UPI0011477B87|nr:hypothetical protein [Streptomyces ipomoeae]TQE33194.1 hypothetical protein Sipo7851_22140 [Streptomyces ipomoeae]
MNIAKRIAVRRYLNRTGMAATFYRPAPTPQEAVSHIQTMHGDSTTWQPADYESVQNLALRRPSRRARLSAWLHRRVAVPFHNLANHPETAGIAVLCVLLPLACLLLVTTGLAIP